MPTVLVIEDDELNLTLFRELLAYIGYGFAGAKTALEGIALAGEVNPALILLDWHLPGNMDGLQAARAIKGDPLLQHIPIVIISAHHEPGIERKVQEAQCVGFVRKPIDINNIRHLLNQLVGELDT